MKLFILSIILCLLGNNSHGRDFKGRVVNCENDGLAYSVVRIPHKRIAVMTDSMGWFTLPIDRVERGDSLEFLSFGYLNKSMSFEEYMNLPHDSIVLVKLPVNLPEVVVRPKKTKRKIEGKQHSWGVVRAILGDMPVKGMGNGYEFHAKDNKRYVLDKVGFYYTDCEDRMTEMKFGIMVYDMNNVRSDFTRDFISVLSKPIEFQYRYNPKDKGKFVFTVPEGIVLPKDAMVEIIFLEEMKDGELLSFKSNIIGKSSWGRWLEDGYLEWFKQPFASPGFVECIEITE